MNHKSPFHLIHLILAAAILAGLAWGFQPVRPAQAAGMVVNSLADSQTNDGACTLREALINANNNNQTGSSDCAAGSGADSITFSVSGTILLGSPLTTIIDPAGLTIDGANGVTISGNGSVQAIYVQAGKSLTLKNLTLKDGNATQGGFIENHGVLNIDHCTFSGNGATKGGAIFNGSEAGTSLTVTNSTFSGNKAQSMGGAIFNYYGDMHVDSSTFSSNQAIAGGSNGGGIYTIGITGDNISVSNSSFQGNFASSAGGGLFNWGPLTITNSTFRSNQALNGGGIWNDGGIYSGQSLTLTVINSTISQNIGGSGAGIYNANSNSATTILKNTIVDSNTGGGGNCSGTITNGGNNLDSGATCGFTTAYGSLSSTNPNLGALTGSPAYLPLNSGSPAIDRVTWSSPNSCPSTDQRGMPRPQGTYCDIGAYEVQKVLVVVPGGQTSGFCGGSTDACDLQYALTSAVAGQEIRVAAGTYKPTIGTDRTATFQLKNGVALYGGFASGAGASAAAFNLKDGLPLHGFYAGSGMLRGLRDPAAYPTILSGDIGVQGNSSDNSYHVVTGATGAILDGFTITGGNANLAPSFNSGGGMYNNLSNPSLANVTFSDNSAFFGGGMYNNLSNPSLTNMTFSDNVAAYGGGMYNEFSDMSLTNATFSGNGAGYNGGGIYFQNASSPHLTNVTFNSNSATDSGDAIYNAISSSPVIQDSIFWGSITQIVSDETSTAAIDDSLIQGGCPERAICNGTMIDMDPLLGVLANNGGPTQTMALLPGSPAIDAGNDGTCATTDQRGRTRPQGLHCDMGAYESNGPTEVSLASFTAQVEKKPSTGNDKSVLLGWKTTSEVDNLGFNLYRATSLNGARVKLNAGLIPTLVPPGSSFGAVYRYTDSGLMDGKTFYYWLEAVDLHGGKELTGPAWVKLVAGKSK